MVNAQVHLTKGNGFVVKILVNIIFNFHCIISVFVPLEFILELIYST